MVVNDSFNDKGANHAPPADADVDVDDLRMAIWKDGVGFVSTFHLNAQEKGSGPGDNGGSEAGTAPLCDTASRHRPLYIFAGGEDALGLVRLTPVAQVEGDSLQIHGTDS